MSRVDDILALAAAYSKAEGLDGPDPTSATQYPFARLGLRFDGKSRFFRNLQRGEVDDYRMEAIESWLSANWPDKLAWPSGIKRRTPSLMDAHHAEMKRQIHGGA